MSLSRSMWLPALAWTVSLAAHALAIHGLDAIPVAVWSSRPPAAVDFVVESSPSPPPPPPRQDAPELPPEPAARAITPAPALEAAPEPEPEPKLEAAPVDLTGVTLTNGTGEGWASALGDGSSMGAPIRAPRRPAAARVEPRTSPRAADRGSTRQAAPGPPRVVSAADLSRRPEPPALEGLLRSNYPREARRLGLAGDARVIARIDADGRVRQVNLATESGPGFGAACRNAVLGSLWTPPLDAQGRAVATQVSYACRFQVDR